MIKPGVGAEVFVHLGHVILSKGYSDKSSLLLLRDKARVPTPKIISAIADGIPRFLAINLNLRITLDQPHKYIMRRREYTGPQD